MIGDRPVTIFAPKRLEEASTGQEAYVVWLVNIVPVEDPIWYRGRWVKAWSLFIESSA